MAMLTMFSVLLNPQSTNLAALIKPVVATTPDPKSSPRPIDQPRMYVTRPMNGASSMALMPLPWVWVDAVVWSDFGSIGWSVQAGFLGDMVLTR